MPDTASPPSPTPPADAPDASPSLCGHELGQTVLVLQGGGALGAYQAGVYEALAEGGFAPDWVIGTSIGAINGGIIAGNAPAARVERLRAFWTRIAHDPVRDAWAGLGWGRGVANAATTLFGVGGFFRPNLAAAWGLPLTPETAGLYDVGPLRATLEGVIDPAVLAARPTRLTVGAARLRTGEMRYFDSRDAALDLRHVMASGALPPAFPPVRIDDELYWDGGLLSNTPLEAVFDDNPRRSALVFVVHIWDPAGPEPGDLRAVLTRAKDMQYASRSSAQVMRQRQIHRLRHVIAELAARVPEAERQSAAVRALAAYGCLTRMHVVRLLAPARLTDDFAKDIDFSGEGIDGRWAAGLADTRAVLAQRPWEAPFDPIEGFILHETAAGAVVGGG